MMLILRQKPFMLLVVLGLLLALCTSGMVAQGAAQPASPEPMVETDGNLVRLTWRTPQSEFEVLSDKTVKVSVPGFDNNDRPGAPNIPMESVLIAISPDSQPTLDFDIASERVLRLPGNLALVPQPESGVTGVENNDSSVLDETLETQSFRDPVAFEILGVIRGVRLARLSFYPVIPAAGQAADEVQLVRIVNQIEITVNVGSISAGLPDIYGDPLLATVRDAVINPSQLRAGVTQPSRSIQNRQPWDPDETVAIEVNRSGLTKLTYQGLAAAGFPVDNVDPNNLHLTRDGAEISIHWDGDADTDFSAGERILFYADARFSRWTWNDVYFLWEDETPGLRMTSRAATPAGMPAGNVWQTEGAEENTIYTPELYRGILVPAGRDGDRWVWDELDPLNQPAASFPINLPTVDTAEPATLDVWLISSTDVPAATDHRVDVAMNGTWLDTAEWNGKQAINLSIPLPAGLLDNGENTLDLSLPGIIGVSEEKVWLDAFQVEHARGDLVVDLSSTFCGETVTSTYSLRLASTTGLKAYQITDPDHPLRLTGLALTGSQISLSDPAGAAGQCYHISSESGIQSPVDIRPVYQTLTGDVNGANYLIISPAEFIPGLDFLIKARENQGLWVEVEDVRAIYDNYGDGRLDPEAIRNFMTFIYENWAPVPNFVLLVGDGTSDPKQYRDNSWETFIPPYLATVDSWAGETAADNRYVAVDGGDNLPDMLIGRLPVNSLEETQQVAKKIAHYELVPPLGDWIMKTVFIADDPDEAGDFPTETEALVADHISQPYQVQRIYYTPPISTVISIRQDIQAGWDQGAGFLVFNGHSSVHFWGAEQFLHLNDIPNLKNGRRLPVLIESTCFTSAFQEPGYATF
ncbi:MAG: hypothetical protein JXA42_22440, partial [Anaerolineales bacterium]|nr:hypothetical protein [Anaerolineales bacterium]